MKENLKKILEQLAPKLYTRITEFKRGLSMREFKKVYPEALIFPLITQDERKLYSQHNQDFIVYENFFKDKNDGIFCDVGGNHPLNLNNTRYFEEIGWTGYAFEPLPYMKDLWTKNRKAKFFSFAASDSEGEVTFSIVKNATGWEDMLSYVDDTATVNYNHETDKIIVKTRKLKDVFNEEHITHIDYMSIDVEGHELNVLHGIDFNKVKINVLTIENSFGGVGEKSNYGDDAVRDVLFKNGFILWGRIIGLDDIFVHKDFIQSLVNTEDTK